MHTPSPTCHYPSLLLCTHVLPLLFICLTCTHGPCMHMGVTGSSPWFTCVSSLHAHVLHTHGCNMLFPQCTHPLHAHGCNTLFPFSAHTHSSCTYHPPTSPLLLPHTHLSPGSLPCPQPGSTPTPSSSSSSTRAGLQGPEPETGRSRGLVNNSLGRCWSRGTPGAQVTPASWQLPGSTKSLGTLRWGGGGCCELR